MRIVLDTGVLVSALLRQRSTPGEVLSAVRSGRVTVLYSTETLVEIIDVLGRPAFGSKYHIQPDDVRALINLIRLRGELVTPDQRMTACRDPQDDKFLELALAGQADCIVTGDADLLSMTPFEGIPILRPAEFLAGL
jgi:putative PIN family toxin of toxin-antitoxin system